MFLFCFLFLCFVCMFWFYDILLFYFFVFYVLFLGFSVMCVFCFLFDSLFLSGRLVVAQSLYIDPLLTGFVEHQLLNGFFREPLLDGTRERFDTQFVIEQVHEGTAPSSSVAEHNDLCGTCEVTLLVGLLHDIYTYSQELLAHFTEVLFCVVLLENFEDFFFCFLSSTSDGCDIRLPAHLFSLIVRRSCNFDQAVLECYNRFVGLC